MKFSTTFAPTAIAVSVLVAGLATPAEAVVGNISPPPTPVTFSDGSVATPIDHCGDTDLCATVTYKNGETLSMYSEGAALCQPYLVLFNRTNGPTTVYTFTRAMNHDAPTTTGFGTRCGNHKQRNSPSITASFILPSRNIKMARCASPFPKSSQSRVFRRPGRLRKGPRNAAPLAFSPAQGMQS